MTITPRIELRTGQSLIMTPQMQQAIKLLQLSNVELKEFVETELIENPLLDRDEGKENLDENMEREHGEAWSIMGNIKELFDPNNIMNPGKLVP